MSVIIQDATTLKPISMIGLEAGVCWGADVTDEEKTQVMEFLSTSFPSIEVGEIDGLQDIYSFIISIE